MSFREQRKAHLRTQFYKKGIDVQEIKRNRETNQFSIRKQKRGALLAKRRNQTFQEGESNMNIPDVAHLPHFASQMRSSDPTKQYEAICAVRLILSSDSPPILEVINLGIAQDLVNILIHSKDTNVQYQSSWALSNVANGTQEETTSLVEYGAVPAFINILTGDYDDKVKVQVIWALGNISADSTSLRDYILHHNILEYLSLAVSSPSIKLRRTSIWCISNLCQGTPYPSFDVIKHIIPTIYKVLSNEYEQEVKTTACWILANISDSGSIQVEHLLASGLYRYIYPFFSTSSELQLTPIIRLVGNIAAGDNRHCSVLLDWGILPMFSKILQEQHSQRIQRETCWAISNIAAGETNQKQNVLDTEGLIETIMHEVENYPLDVQKEAMWIITNLAAEATAEQIQKLIHFDVFNVYTQLLIIPDQNLVTIIIEGLEYIFTSGEGIAELTGGANPYLKLLEQSGAFFFLQQLMESSCSTVRDAVIVFMDRFDNSMADEYITPKFTNDFSFENLL